MNDRTLIYNCCDDEYTHFIPLYCGSSLFSNKNIDIEIGVNLKKLENSEEESIEQLRLLHPESQINIKYGFYKKIKERGFKNALFNGVNLWSNTIRFISEPEIKNAYTFIGDIDIVMLSENFYNYHINIMNEYGTDYSNWVRDNDPTRLTGLHFVKTDTFYPQNTEGISLSGVDERILKEIQSRVCEINYKIPRRPINGLHFSKNQPLKEQLKLCDTLVNEIKSYKNVYNDFLGSEEYNIVKKCNTGLINKNINDFLNYYKSLK